jgi:Multiubiquitin
MKDNQDNKGEQTQKKEVTIIVNGRERTVAKDELSFDDIVALAFANPPTGENILITIVYRRGHGDKPEGSLVPEGSVRVKDGMIFDVTATDKS